MVERSWDRAGLEVRGGGGGGGCRSKKCGNKIRYGREVCRSAAWGNEEWGMKYKVGGVQSV